jgi:hypothetical protein
MRITRSQLRGIVLHEVRRLNEERGEQYILDLIATALENLNRAVDLAQAGAMKEDDLIELEDTRDKLYMFTSKFD